MKTFIRKYKNFERKTQTKKVEKKTKDEVSRSINLTEDLEFEGGTEYSFLIGYFQRRVIMSLEM